jgi:sugar lactone lactonase YvrE
MAVLALPPREPSAIYLDADPNGLALLNGVLFVADAETGTILRADNERLVSLPGEDVRDLVRGIAAAPDGALYATTRHAVYRITPDGSAIELDLSPQPWRLGIACRGRAVYTTQFYKGPDGPYGGEVVRIADGRVTTIARGFHKPVGLAWVGDSLLVTDAAQRGVFAIDGRRYVRALAAPDLRPDSICAYGHDSALVTTYDKVLHRGAVLRVWLDGRSREVASGPWEPRGIATDGELVFVSERHGGRVLVLAL